MGARRASADRATRGAAGTRSPGDCGPALTWFQSGRGAARSGGGGAGGGVPGAGRSGGGAGPPADVRDPRARPLAAALPWARPGLPRACGPRRACPRRRPRPALGRAGRDRAGPSRGPSRGPSPGPSRGLRRAGDRARTAGRTRRPSAGRGPGLPSPAPARLWGFTGRGIPAEAGQRRGGGGPPGAPGQAGPRRCGGGPGLRQAGRSRPTRVYATRPGTCLRGLRRSRQAWAPGSPPRHRLGHGRPRRALIQKAPLPPPPGPAASLLAWSLLPRSLPPSSSSSPLSSFPFAAVSPLSLPLPACALLPPPDCPARLAALPCPWAQPPFPASPLTVAFLAGAAEGASLGRLLFFLLATMASPAPRQPKAVLERRGLPGLFRVGGRGSGWPGSGTAASPGSGARLHFALNRDCGLLRAGCGR